MRKTSKAYAAAGVDIDLGNQVKGTLPQLLASTRRPGVLGKVGGFGGLFALDTRRYREPVLVSSVDGVGTKLKIAFALKRHDTIGQDLVNHCVNDIAVLGAEPLFFLDYLGTGKLQPLVFEAILRGFAQACSENHCALIGGETAQMPGFYQPGEYDLSGTIVGVVERSRMLDGPRTIQPGDVLLGMASNGLHTNGYSLARKVLLEQLGLRFSSKIPGLTHSLGDELLQVHVSYGPTIQKLLRQFQPPPPTTRPSPRTSHRPVRAFAHITGGGFIDNLPRILPPSCNARIQLGSWPLPPLFQFLQEKGRIDPTEMYQVFNMGIGMIAVVDPKSAPRVLRFLRRRHPTWIIGDISKGTGKTALVSAA
jgi:phosphoribosylformylglycinamidine cyclo-ligase